MRQAIRMLLGLWLVLTFSGCLDLAGDWVEFEEPGWVSPSGKYYQDGALTLPMGECKEYHSEADCQVFSHWGPFGVVNSEFIPLCINNRRFSPGSMFFDGADDKCLGLMGVDEHTYDDYVVPGAALIYPLLGDELENVKIPDMIDGDLVVNVGPVHFAESWFPLMGPPVIRFWVDIVEGFEIPLDEAESYELEICGFTLWYFNVTRVYIPKASLLAEVSFSLGDWENLQHAWWGNTIRISFVDATYFQDWIDPVINLDHDCKYDPDKAGCQTSLFNEAWYLTDECDHDAPRTHYSMVERVGTRNVFTGETIWCRKCSEEEFRDALPRVGDYRCIATNNGGLNELISELDKKSELWTIFRRVLSEKINRLLRDNLREISRKLLFNREAHNFMGGWYDDYMVLSFEQNPVGDRGKGVVMRRGADPDKDNIWSNLDNCPQDPNRYQQDCDDDAQGDACDPTNCIGPISISPTFGDALPDDQGIPQRRVGNWARQSFRTTGGASKNQPVEHMAALAWCACDDMDDDFCVEEYCIQDGDNHQTYDFHGWYPESWFDGEPCTRDAEGYCEPLPEVSYVRLDDKSSLTHDYHRINWDWRHERLPPDGEPQIENGKRYFKFRGFSVEDADLTPAFPEAVYTFTSVASLEYYVGPLELGNFEQGVFLVPMGQDLAELTASVMGWFKRCSSGDDCLPNSLVLTFDELTGQLDQWIPSTVTDEILEPMVLADQARVVLSGESGLDWYTFGGVNPDGTFADDLWHGVMHSPLRWDKVDARGVDTELSEIAVGELPRELIANPLALLPGGKMVVVSNKASDDLSLVSLTDKSMVACLTGFDGPLGLAVDDGRRQLWVANSEGDSLSLVDLESLAVVEQVQLPGYRPATLIMAQKIGKLFIGAWAQTSSMPAWHIFTLDLATHGVDTNTVVYYGEQLVDAMALSPDESKLYVARSFQKIDVYETMSNVLVETWSLGRTTSGLALTPDGSRMVVTSAPEGLVSVYDASNFDLLGEVSGLPNASGVDMDLLGTRVLVTGYSGSNGEQGRLWWIDLDDMSVVESFDVGDLPTTVSFLPNGQGACVVNTNSDSITYVENLGTDGAKPEARAGAVLVGDSDTGLLRLLGGQGAQGVLDDEWTFEPAKELWRRRVSADSDLALAHPSLARDPESGDTFVFGGLGTEGPSNITYRVSWYGRVEKMDLLTRSASPEPRSRAALAYLPELNALYVFGGLADGAALGDSWLFSLENQSWRALASENGSLPEARWGTAAVPLQGGKVAVFGGTSQDSSIPPVVWTQDLESGQWQVNEEAMPPVGVRVGGLWRIDYLGKRLDHKIASGFDDTALQVSMPRGSQRSLRWVGELRIDESGPQRIFVDAKGGVRVFVDGKPLRMRGAAFGSCGRLNTESVPIELAVGWHQIVLDWTVCKQGGELAVSLSSGENQSQVIDSDRLRHRWMGGLSRKAYSLRRWFWQAASEDFDVTPIDDDWGRDAPVVLGLSNKDRFAVSWEGELRIEVPGAYRFDVDVDDMGWLSIDGQDLWSGKGKGTSQGIWLDAGQHEIRFVAFDFFGSAHAHLKVHSSSPDLGGLFLPAERCSAPPMP